MGNAFAYRITFENDPKANAPAQIVTIANNLSTSFDRSTFKLTGIGFGDFNLVIPPGSQHYETTLSMTYNGQTFNVQVETGIHGDTGQVYATFTSIDPNTGLPPSNVLTGFLPPENGTGRGEGYLTYTISPKLTVPNSTVIRNVAYITFDGNQPIATDQVDDDDPSKGTDPTKEAPVTVDTTIPTSHITSATPSTTSPTIAVAWTGSDVGGSGVASYSVYVSTNGGQTYSAWLTNTTLTSAVYQGTTGHTYYFYVAATSNVGTVQTTFQPVSATTYATYPPQITSALTATATTGKAFSYQIVASNSPASYAASGLPSGLGVNTTTGLISGTPTQVGVFSVGLKATNAGGSGTATLTLTVDAPTYPVITSAGTAPAYLTKAFSYQITATNTPATYGATGLPSGLGINTASGLISGTPTQTGVFNVGLSATNAGGTGTLALVLTVNPAPVSPPTITSALTVNTQATVAFSYQITASNMPSVYGASGLPAGLTVNTASGLISGTPMTVGTYPVTLSATNTGGTGTATLSLNVAAAPVVFPTITSATSATTIVGYSFGYQITATNNPTSYAANGLPAGLSVNTATGLISGTPTTIGIYNVSLGATNAGGTGTATLTLAVNAQPVPAPVITSVLGVNGQATVGFSYQITASNSPVSFNASGLPAGLTVNTASGLISGAPATTGVYSIVIAAANSTGTGTATLTLTVSAPPAHAAFFSGEVPLSNGVYYLSFPNGNYFGYYSYLNVPGDPHYLYHFDMGYEYIFDAQDGRNGVYFYDFKSSTFFYTSPTFPFPYLYDFTLNSVLYYYPDPNNPGRYNTNGTRYFYEYKTGQIIVK